MNLSVRHIDTVVVGSGVAGLTTALMTGNCLVVSKSVLGAGSSRWAQGGIAAAVDAHDDPAFHADDTLRVSGGLGDRYLTAIVTAGGPEQIEWLLELGADFDRDETGELTVGREAGHGRRRIVHANGDATGAEVIRTLERATRRRPDISVLEDFLVVDLIHQDDRIAGVYAIDADDRRVALLAGTVVLATGGIGQVYAHTTNPREVTGDGLAMAVRAGARIRDPEFVQFHPTALATNSDPMPLLTEALRGEGAVLVDADGHRYMPAVHDDAELAPRDVVARANWDKLREGPIYLDATGIGESFPERFPTVFEHARRAGMDPRRDPLPVSPAQHYHMGGIATDSFGRTTAPGLFAVGEAASTGLHGANRLASNSLLEGLVIGARAALAIQNDPRTAIDPRRCEVPATAAAVERDDDDAAVADLRAAMWEYAGVVRDDAGLRKGLGVVADLLPSLETGATGRNLANAAATVLESALDRRESRGSHWRSDHPGLDPSGPRHTIIDPKPVERVSITTRRGATV